MVGRDKKNKNLISKTAMFAVVKKRLFSPLGGVVRRGEEGWWSLVERPPRVALVMLHHCKTTFYADSPTLSSLYLAETDPYI